MYDSESFYFVPDPVKLVSKLGRKDLKNYDHVEDYRVSIKDLIVSYRDARLGPLLTEAVAERYGSYIELSVVIAALIQLADSPEQFKTLYTLPNGSICDDPLRPKLD